MSLVMVSTRLPVTLRPGPGGPALVESVGGLASGLRGLDVVRQGAWIGWPGPTGLPGSEGEADLTRRLETQGCVPVFLSREEVRGFYQGYANGVIWPLFHYLIQQLPLRPRHWEAYDRVNRRFAEVVAARCGPADEVWIHDYQLMRVPHYLRQLRPGARIGFFLHIPFPAFDVFRILPSRRLLLEGLLGADLLGFHTAAYAEHFTAAVNGLLGVASLEDGRLDCGARTPKVGAFPMGIEVTRFAAGAGTGPFERERAGRGQSLVAIDRLDYTKGIPRRLLAFEELLTRHQDLVEKVTLIQVAVPSRTGVKAYQRYRRHVDAMVGRINGTFGSPGWVPVQYLYCGFTQSELVALFRSADVMLVTPVRDGMNLVAKEFVASRVDGDGVLVLSEFAGAAAELTEAVIVNPYDVVETAEAYHRALTMPRHERRSRMRALRQRVQATGVEAWAASFLETLRAAGGTAPVAVEDSAAAEVAAVRARLAAAPALLLLLDYDGTLVPFGPTPESAAPGDDLLDLLRGLASRPGLALHLVSGRPRSTLEAWFGELAVGLHAEHGMWSRRMAGVAWERVPGARPVPYDDVLALLRRYTESTPGSHIERKSAGLAWHFWLAPADGGHRAADALVEEARRRYPPDVVDVLRGEHVVEIRPAGIQKGLIVTRLLAEAGPGTLVVAVGDDVTDEDMFAAVPAQGLTIHVGPRPSRAGLRLRDVAACHALLRGLLASRRPGADG
ncbi:MAG: bifunctional alpha,alpha-trehalose-phosphate synthase (UDP-forming)/trehalose-phosphatase [Gemmatimonadetes bacterium]|nr:bifunctional alpha,alpha-trehalose-phosphate synthase (UDP-forming)/trehalose-phosphatase [Gemmatimonadota bacterium]MBK7785808.1 bifunctional alpha,alpha-trehalose-phosphate synthase (UDP-forming)/trehalose-phosphatase [Gemmatimonadota bacterium]MBK9067072.1 bifunctional alpha,alpha-trehalose-phosphate synthase (UDP-forming)/trehalose-phosphatase [Gemmatimonadota bacterium]